MTGESPRLIYFRRLHGGEQGRSHPQTSLGQIGTSGLGDPRCEDRPPDDLRGLSVDRVWTVERARNLFTVWRVKKYSGTFPLLPLLPVLPFPPEYRGVKAEIQRHRRRFRLKVKKTEHVQGIGNTAKVLVCVSRRSIQRASKISVFFSPFRIYGVSFSRRGAGGVTGGGSWQCGSRPHCWRGLCSVVLAQAAVAAEPAERPLHDPGAWAGGRSPWPPPGGVWS